MRERKKTNGQSPNLASGPSHSPTSRSGSNSIAVKFQPNCPSFSFRKGSTRRWREAELPMQHSPECEKRTNRFFCGNQAPSKSLDGRVGFGLAERTGVKCLTWEKQEARAQRQERVANPGGLWPCRLACTFLGSHPGED